MKKIPRKLVVTFLVLTLLFSTGWSRGGAFLAGCLASLLFLSAVKHDSSYHTTTVIYHSDKLEKFQCRVCHRVYMIPEGAPEHTCPNCGTVYHLRQ